jgi:hypothetical protein
MKKIALAVLIASALVAASTTVASATPKKPSVTTKGGAEGTKSHESSESSNTEGAEGGAKAKKIPAKKPTMKKAAVKK